MTTYEWLAYCDELALFEAGIVDVPAVVEPGDRVTFLDAGNPKSGKVLANTGSGIYIAPDEGGPTIRATIGWDGHGSAIIAQEHVDLPALQEAAIYIKQLGPRKPVAPIGPALRHELGELAPALPSPPAAGLSEAEYRERLHPRNRRHPGGRCGCAGGAFRCARPGSTR